MDDRKRAGRVSEMRALFEKLGEEKGNSPCVSPSTSYINSPERQKKKSKDFKADSPDSTDVKSNSEDLSIRAKSDRGSKVKSIQLQFHCQASTRDNGRTSGPIWITQDSPKRPSGKFLAWEEKTSPKLGTVKTDFKIASRRISELSNVFTAGEQSTHQSTATASQCVKDKRTQSSVQSRSKHPTTPPRKSVSLPCHSDSKGASVPPDSSPSPSPSKKSHVNRDSELAQQSSDEATNVSDKIQHTHMKKRKLSKGEGTEQSNKKMWSSGGIVPSTESVISPVSGPSYLSRRPKCKFNGYGDIDVQSGTYHFQPSNGMSEPPEISDDTEKIPGEEETQANESGEVFGETGLNSTVQIDSTSPCLRDPKQVCDQEIDLCSDICFLSHSSSLDTCEDLSCSQELDFETSNVSKDQVEETVTQNDSCDTIEPTGVYTVNADDDVSENSPTIHPQDQETPLRDLNDVADAQTEIKGSNSGLSQPVMFKEDIKNKGPDEHQIKPPSQPSSPRLQGVDGDNYSNESPCEVGKDKVQMSRKSDDQCQRSSVSDSLFEASVLVDTETIPVDEEVTVSGETKANDSGDTKADVGAEKQLVNPFTTVSTVGSHAQGLSPIGKGDGYEESLQTSKEHMEDTFAIVGADNDALNVSYRSESDYTDINKLVSRLEELETKTRNSDKKLNEMLEKLKRTDECLASTQKEYFTLQDKFHRVEEDHTALKEKYAKMNDVIRDIQSRASELLSQDELFKVVQQKDTENRIKVEALKERICKIEEGLRETVCEAGTTYCILEDTENHSLFSDKSEQSETSLVYSDTPKDWDDSCPLHKLLDTSLLKSRAQLVSRSKLAGRRLPTRISSYHGTYKEGEVTCDMEYHERISTGLEEELKVAISKREARLSSERI